MNSESLSSFSSETLRRVSSEKELAKQHLSQRAIGDVLAQHSYVTQEELDVIAANNYLSRTQMRRVVGLMNLAYFADGYGYQPTEEQLRSEQIR